jgi:hypothetical protein
MGGTPKKTPQQLKTEKNVQKLKELKHDLSKPKHLFEYNNLKTELTGKPNPNQEIGSSMINRAIKAKIARKELENKKAEKKSVEAAKTIQSIYRGSKTRNTLANDKDFQYKIDMKIKRYGNEASEFKTRGADSKKVNNEFSDIMKNMRTGLQKYKTTLGTQPKKRGPKPKNPYEGLKQTEI